MRGMLFVWKLRVFDYVTCVLLAIMAWLLDWYAQPYCRPFSFADSSIQYSRAKLETFPTYSVIVAVALVVLFYVIGEFFTWRRQGCYAVLCSINNWVVAHFFSICLGFFIVSVAKVYAGRLRPDFIQRLAEEGIIEKNIKQFSREEICAAARKGRLSFPSGHSGTAFAGFVPLTLYLLGVTQVFRTGLLYLATLSVLPLSFPIIVSISRTRDNYHHFADIVAGAAVGTFSAIFSVLTSFTIGSKGQWLRRSDVYEALFLVSNADQTGRNVSFDREMHRGTVIAEHV